MITKERLQNMFNTVDGELQTARLNIYTLNDINNPETELLIMKCMQLEGKMIVLNQLIEDW